MAKPYARDTNREYVYQGDVVNFIRYVMDSDYIETCIVYRIQGKDKIDVITKEGITYKGIPSWTVALANWDTLGDSFEVLREQSQKAKATEEVRDG